jgi:hypothetical protein
LPGREAEYLNQCLQLAAAQGPSPPPSPDYEAYLSSQQIDFFGEPQRVRPQQKTSRRRQQQIHDAEERGMMEQFLKIDLVRRCWDLEKQVQDPQFVEWQHHQQQLDQQQQKRDKHGASSRKKSSQASPAAAPARAATTACAPGGRA